MPWLAPIGTPLASGPIDSHEPIWQSSRAARLAGSALTRQAAREQRQPVQGLRVGIGVGFARADALDAVVDRADAGREPQPFGRVHGNSWVEHDRARDDVKDGGSAP